MVGIFSDFGTATPTPTPTDEEDRSGVTTGTGGIFGDLADQYYAEGGQAPTKEESEGGGSTLGNAFGFLTSGEDFLGAISGGKIDISGLKDKGPLGRLGFEALDLAVNPLSFASVALAPVALPARLAVATGARGVGGRLAFRVAADTALGAAAVIGGKATAEVLEDTNLPGPIKFAAPLAVGLAGGAVTGTAINRAVQGQARNARNVASSAEAATDAAATGNKFVVELPHIEDVTDGVRHLDEAAGVDRLAQLAESAPGLNPGLRANTNSMVRVASAFGRMLRAIPELTKVSVTSALPKGMDAFTISDDGIIQNIRGASDVKWNDVFSHPKAAEVYGFNATQRAQHTAYMAILDDVPGMLGRSDITRPLLDNGQLYVPRQVKSIDGIELTRPSDPSLQRLHEHATAAARENGIVYDNDPMNVIKLHLEGAYREVAEKQFDDAISEFMVTPSSAFGRTEVGKAVGAHHREASSAWRAARAAERRASDAVKKAEAALAEQKGLRTQRNRDAVIRVREARLRHAIEARESAREILTTASQSLQRSKRDAQAAFQRFKGAPGRVTIGNADEAVEARVWRNNFISKQNYEALENWYERATGLRFIDNALAKTPAQVVQDIANIQRQAVATADFAMPFIQGLPVLFTNPQAWSRMAYQHYRAFFRADTQGVYMANTRNRLAVEEMVRDGRVPFGDVEFFEASRRGTFVGRGIEGLKASDNPLTQSIGSALAVPRNTALAASRPFQRAYDTGLMVARAELWQALKPSWRGTSEELGTHIKRMTGGLDSRDLLIGGNQRLAETLMFFSPRLVRSTAALMADALRPNTPQGEQALTSMYRMSAAATGVVTMGIVASGLAQGLSEAEIEENMRTALNPAAGKKFLSVEVDGNWYGLGGQVRSMVHFAANAPGGFASLGEGDVQGFLNPFVEFLDRRKSPGADTALAITELATGADTLAFDEIDSVPQLLSHIGTNFTPIVAQGLIESYQDGTLMEDKDGNIAVTLGELLGARASLPSPTEQLDQKSEDAFGVAYNELTGQQKEIINAAYPETLALKQKNQPAEARETRSLIDKNNADATEALQGVATRYEDGTLDGAQLREAIDSIRFGRAVRNQEVTESIEFADPTSIAARVVSAYFTMLEASALVPGQPDAGLDFESYELGQAELERRIEEGEFGTTDSDKQRARAALAERTKFELPPELGWYQDAKDVIADAGYWDIKDQAFLRVADRIRSQFPDVESYTDLRTELNRAKLVNDINRQKRVEVFLDLVDSLAATPRKVARLRNRELDEALVLLGYREQTQIPRR